MTTQPAAGQMIDIAILAYPGAQLAAILGLTDLFAIASAVAADRYGAGAAALRVSHVGLARESVGGLCSSFVSSPGLPGPPAVIIVPPTLDDVLVKIWDPQLTAFLAASHQAGTVLASVCAGAFLLAASGITAGRRVTTHWCYAEALADRFAATEVAADALIIDDGDLITAGGLMAWTDLGLTLVERFLGPLVMVTTARQLLVDPPGRDQRRYRSFVPRLSHGDAAVLKVQQWLPETDARRVTAAAMAAVAGLESRTFLRRFQKATGLKPIEYCQHLRIGEARTMLEATTQPVDHIAWTVGYDDPASFRRLFHKITGLTPGAYRQRCGLGGTPSALGRAGK